MLLNKLDNLSLFTACLPCVDLYLLAVAEFRESRLFRQRWPSTPQLAVTAAPEAMQAEEAVDFLTGQNIRDTAVRLCMLGCGDAICCSLETCEPKAVQLYDDAEVRETMFRVFGEVSRSQFEALCAEGYKHRKRLVSDILLSQENT
jgi:hypothetical protein